MGRALFWILLAVWAGLYAWSFTAFWLLEPTGDGWVRGLNRLTSFLGWQFAAGLAALLVWGASGVWPRGSALPWLGRAPLALALALLTALLAFYLFAMIDARTSSPDAPAEPPEAVAPRPVTEPAEPVEVEDPG